MSQFCARTLCFSALDAAVVCPIPSGETRGCRHRFLISSLQRKIFFLPPVLGTYVTRSSRWQAGGPDLLPSGGCRASLKPGQQRLLRSLEIWGLRMHV